MKLKQILFLFLCILIFACNSDDSDNSDEEQNNDTSSVLLKKVIETYDGDTYTTNYTYDDNKLILVDNGNGRKNIYTYENDLLIKDEQYYNNGILGAVITLSYNSENKVEEFIETWSDFGNLIDLIYKHVITYNDNNTLTDEIYRSDEGSEFKFSYTKLYTFEGENISNIKYIEDDYQLIYSFDDKNSIYKNIHALEVLNILTETEFGSFIYGKTNNLISLIESDLSTNVLYDETFEYTYNNDNYPESAKIYSDGELDMTIEYFYE